MVTLSLVTLIGSLLSLPLVVAALPEDYFLAQRRHPFIFRRLHPVLSLLLWILKNGLGWLLVLAGLLMLVLPGQGLLTLVVGLILSDFPGKFQLERRLAAEPRVLGALNRLRSLAKRPPLKAPPTNGKA